MNEKLGQSAEKFASCTVSQAVYEQDGAIFTVIRHFTGDKTVSQTVAEIALSRANREAGLN